MDAIKSGEKRDDAGRFIVPPVSPGRPKGARSKLGEAFIEALHDDFVENGVAAIQVVRAEKPDQYLKVIASLLPKDVNLSINDQYGEMSDDELIDRIRQLDATIAPFLAGREGASSETDTGAAVGTIAAIVH
jgi:hypothetical protein